MLSSFKKLLLPLLLLFLLNLGLFIQLYFKHLLPFPGNLLVSYYYPWTGGGFLGFDPWTTRKDVIAMDVIRQMYPWKSLIFDLLKNGNWPLWNPFNFSGTPLLANLQSSVFFPGNFIFLILPPLWAWISLVVGLPLVFSLFAYIFLRSLKLSLLASIFGAVVMSNLSAVVVWAEQLVVIQSAIFLPLDLWAVTKYSQTKKLVYLWLLPIFLACSVFGGHIQTTSYVFLITTAYALFRKTPLKYYILCLGLAISLSAVQLFPSFELYLNSARESSVSRELFYQSTFPWQNLITVLVPDFYGNPATNNFRGRDYGNFQGYFGIAALLLAALSWRYWSSSKEIKFWSILALLGLVFSLSPFAYVFDKLHIPVLSSGYPSRMIFVFQLSMGVLAAYGLDRLTRHS